MKNKTRKTLKSNTPFHILQNINLVTAWEY